MPQLLPHETDHESGGWNRNASNNNLHPNLATQIDAQLNQSIIDRFENLDPISSPAGAGEMPTEQRTLAAAAAGHDQLFRRAYLRQIVLLFAQILVYACAIVALFSLASGLSENSRAKIPALFGRFFSQRWPVVTIAGAIAGAMFAFTVFAANMIEYDLTRLLDSGPCKLLAALFAFGLISLATMAIPNRIISQFACSAMVLIVVLTLLAISTQLIIGGRQYELSIDTHQLAAILLFSDLVAIFLYVIPNVYTVFEAVSLRNGPITNATTLFAHPKNITMSSKIVTLRNGRNLRSR